MEIFLADGDRRALRVVDAVVLDDPALGPVRADQAGLVGGRRRPRGGGLGELEPADGDVVEVVLGRVEDRAADVDLDDVRRSGSAPWKLAQIVVCVVPDFGVPDQSGSAPGRGSGSTAPVQSSITSVRSGGSGRPP